MSFLTALGSFLGSDTFGTAASLFSTGFQAYNDYQSGQDAYKAAEYNKDLEAFNTDQQLRIQRERTKRLVGEQRASAAAVGVRSGTGSPLQMRLETVSQSAIDEYYIKRGGELRQAARIYEGQTVRTTSRIAAGDAVITGVTDLAKVYGKQA